MMMEWVSFLLHCTNVSAQQKKEAAAAEAQSSSSWKIKIPPLSYISYPFPLLFRTYPRGSSSSSVFFFLAQVLPSFSFFSTFAPFWLKEEAKYDICTDQLCGKNAGYGKQRSYFLVVRSQLQKLQKSYIVREFHTEVLFFADLLLRGKEGEKKGRGKNLAKGGKEGTDLSHIRRREKR